MINFIDKLFRLEQKRKFASIVKAKQKTTFVGCDYYSNFANILWQNNHINHRSTEEWLISSHVRDAKVDLSLLNSG